MQIHIKDNQGKSRYLVQVSLNELPAAVHLNQKNSQTITLDWDRALDDENHLRHCPVCGSEGLYVKKPMPRVIAFAFIALAAILAMIITGLHQVTWAAVVFFVILIVDICAWFLQGKTLNCYYCASEFSGVPIRKGHSSWNKLDAQKFGANSDK